MKSNRRRFCKYALAGTGVAVGVGSLWVGVSQSRFARLFRMILSDSRRSILPAPVKPDPLQWSDNAITICWLGHATALINFYGLRILTDPTFGNHIGVSLGLGIVGPKRYVAPALRPDELPPIDLLLLSHAHMDHMDLASLAHFASDTPVVTAKTTTDVLNVAGLKRITELKWAERTTVTTTRGDVQIEAFEVKHWGERWPSKLQRGYNGYALRREGRSLLFGGDTAHTPLFSEVRPRGPFEAALMPIGAYQPWIRNHCTPEQAVELANLAGAKHIVPIHHQTFRLSNEPMNEPIERFQAALQREPERVALRRIGESFVCPAT